MARYDLYLSGPMTGYKEKNFPAFHKAAKALRKKGYRVCSPAELDTKHPRQTWAACLRRDLIKEMDCDGIALLSGWKRSRGALLEKYNMDELGGPVHTVNYWLKRRR